MANGEPVLGSLYVYAPNKAAPVFFAFVFAVSACVHTWHCVRYNGWRLMGLQPACAFMYSAGYVLREVGAFHYIFSNTSLAVYIVSQVLIYICPPLLELSNYHVLGRLLSYAPTQAPISARNVLSIFGGLVMVVEALNGLGVAFVSNPTSTASQQSLGSDLVIASVAVQLFVIASCVSLAALFHSRCRTANIKSKGVLISLYALYWSMTLIMVRSIYRLVEHLGSTAVKIDDLDALHQLSPLLRNESYFYVFEASTMLLNSLLWNLCNPSWYLPQKANVHLTPDGSGEVEEVEDVDSRSWVVKAACVLTFGILFRRQKRQGSFVELETSADSK